MKNFFSRLTAIAATTAMLASYAVIPAFAEMLNPTATFNSTTNVVTLALPNTKPIEAAGKIRFIVRGMDTSVVNIGAGTTIDNGAAMTVDSTNAATGILVATANGSTVATAITLTFPAGTFTADTSYQISVFTDINGDGNYSDGDFGSTVFTNGISNDVIVKAQVEPTLTLVLAGKTPNLGILTPDAVSASDSLPVAEQPTATVSTNALEGFTLSVKDSDANVGLYSPYASYLIPATATVVAGTEGFNIAVSQKAAGTAQTGKAGSITAAFNGQVTAADQAIATSNGAINGYQVGVNVKAAISAITPAAEDYTTSLTFTATANF